jgi:hypothetical protein
MTTLKIQGIPDRVLRELKRRAKARRRSLEREIILCLERSCELVPFDSDAWLARADRLRNKLGLRGLTNAQLRAEKRRGRA